MTTVPTVKVHTSFTLNGVSRLTRAEINIAGDLLIRQGDDTILIKSRDIAAFQRAVASLKELI